MSMPTCYSICLNESLRKQQNSYPAVGLSRQNIYAEQYQQQYFLLFGTDIEFCGYKLKSLSRWCLDIRIFTYEGLGIYPI